jgi:hypothetical protein
MLAIQIAAGIVLAAVVLRFPAVALRVAAGAVVLGLVGFALLWLAARGWTEGAASVAIMAVAIAFAGSPWGQRLRQMGRKQGPQG